MIPTENIENKPLVSIVVPVYNAGIYLRPAIDSLLSQTYSNLEIIVVDDGSTDNCLDALRDIKDGRLRVVQQNNAGKSVAMNRALSMLKGKYYAIQDADDLAYPVRVERLAAVLESDADVGAVFSGYDVIINDRRVAPRYVEKSVQECRMDIDCMRMPSHDPTGMYRVAAVKGMEYDPELRIGQGYDYILRVGERTAMRVIGECLYSYRINVQSNTRNASARRNEMVQKVWAKAMTRRGSGTLNTTAFRRADHNNADHGITAHFMESVLDLRRTGNYKGAFNTAMFILSLDCGRIHYYKPLLYVFMPLGLISYYRRKKRTKRCIA